MMESLKFMILKKESIDVIIYAIILFGVYNMSYINKYLRNFTPYKVASHRVWGVKPELRPEILKLD